MTDRPRVFSQSIFVFFGFLGFSIILIYLLFVFSEQVANVFQISEENLELLYYILPPDLSMLTGDLVGFAVVNILLTALIISLMTHLLNSGFGVRGSIVRSLIFASLISGISFLISGAIFTGLVKNVAEIQPDGMRRLLGAVMIVGTSTLKGWLPALASTVAFHVRVVEKKAPDPAMYPKKLKIKWRGDMPADETITSSIPPLETAPPPTKTSVVLSSQFLQAMLNALAVIAILVGIALASNLVPGGCRALTPECIGVLNSSWLWPIFLLLVTMAASFGSYQMGNHHKTPGAVGLAFFISLILVGIFWQLGITTLFEEVLAVRSWLGILLDILIITATSAAGAIIGYHSPKWGL